MAREDDNVDKPNLLGRNYGIELYVAKSSRRDTQNKVQLSKFVKNVRILHTIDSIWPQIFISIDADALDFIENDIYGQKTMTLKIVRSDQDAIIKESFTFEILCLESDISLTPKTYITGTSSPGAIDFQTTTLICVPLHAYNMMSSFVNNIIEETDPAKTNMDNTGIGLLERLIINDLQFDRSKIEIDKRGKNVSEINQLVVPPMTLKDAVSYINDEFYYYDGPAFRFCDIDGNFKMWNLHEKMKDVPAIDAILLPSVTSSKDPKLMEELLERAAYDKAIMFADDYVKTIYGGNNVIVKEGFQQIFIAHPGDDLYKLVIDDMANAAVNNSTADPDAAQGLKIHPNVRNRKRYTHNNGGTGDGDSNQELVTSKISETIIAMSGMSITLSRDLYLENLFRIGEPISFRGFSLGYLAYEGKYLFWSSDIVLSREQSDNWLAKGVVKMVRTNQSQIDNNNLYDRLPSDSGTSSGGSILVS
jgi:hypothetical protein